MAKKALFDVLERTIGKYVLNLDAESLNVAIWSGKIELHSLELDIHAVNQEISRRAQAAPNLALPFRVTSGQFTSFQVDVPWTNLTNKPVVLRAQGLNVSVEPFDHLVARDDDDLVYSDNENDVDAKTALVRAQREKALQAADEFRRQALALQKLAEQDFEPDAASSQKTSSSTFGARLVRRILENIQIEITNVHISLEGAGCSTGVMLEFFQLATTDRLGNRTFVDRTAGKDKDSSFLHKALMVRGLGVYMDEHASEKQAMPAIAEHDSNDDDGHMSRHSYIIAPLSFEAKLRQADSTICRDYPKYLLESEIHSLSFLLSKIQLELFRTLAKQLRPPQDEQHLVPLFPEYRPLVRPSSQSAHEWWKYAYRCIGRLNGRRAWLQFYEAFRLRKQYIALYKRQAFASSCPWLNPLTTLEEEDLQRIEQDRTISVEGIMTWRTMATSQVDKERVKYQASSGTPTTTTRSSLLRSLFGSPAGTVAASATEQKDAESVPPISLSAEEMRQLETISMDRLADLDLSTDSRLCDVKFVLGSLETNLAAYDLRPLTGLEMGTVTALFRANVDGSFVFDCSMASLAISDRVTPRSCFPKILQNEIKEDDVEVDQEHKALHAHLSRTKAGDQVVRVHLGTFEAVASPMLVLEMQQFFSEKRDETQAGSRNPVLAQSMSGSVDIFYDASEGSSLAVAEASHLSLQTDTSGLPAAFDASNALIAAWRSKSETKASWVIDLDIQAPIVIMPESCTDPRANVLVLNLGRFHLLYGTGENHTSSLPRVCQWFDDNPRDKSLTSTRPSLEFGSLSVTNLALAIGKAHDCRISVVTKDFTTDQTRVIPVFEPMCLETSFGVEDAELGAMPRICLFGVVPTIGLNVSGPHLSAIVSVFNVWHDVGFASNRAVHASPEPVDVHTSSQTLRFSDKMRKGSQAIVSPSSQQPAVYSSCYVQMSLQRLSAKIGTNTSADGLEAHLVAVSSSWEALSDSSTLSRLTMGWFWIVDNIESSFPRTQRLIAHSRLPLDVTGIAQRSYRVLDELDALGVFGDDFAGSSELADVSFRTAVPRALGDPFDPTQTIDTVSADRTVDARFTTLNINWNPRAIKQTVETMDSIFSVSREIESSTLLSSPTQLEQRDNGDEVPDEEREQSTAVVLVRLSMERFELCLNSAKDDLPLFLLAMSRADCHYLTSGVDSRMSLKVDDLTVATPGSGKTLSVYSTILGLSPGYHESLLSVNYFGGSNALRTADLHQNDIAEYEAYASVAVSPMRLVYIHAQVLSLAEYATEGILGTITANAASAAVQMAEDLVNPQRKSKKFHICATGLEICTPQAAYSEHFLSVKSKMATLSYISSPSPATGKAGLALSSVLICDSGSRNLLENDVSMEIDVSLPPIGMGNEEEQAIRVKLAISEASFVVSKLQYQQVVDTIAANLGELDLFVRDTESGEFVDPQAQSMRRMAGHPDESLTHAGVAVVDIPRRVYVDTKLSAVRLLLVHSSECEPIICLSAVKAKITLALLGDKGSTKAEATLKDLVCTDERIESIGRQHRSLVYQGTSSCLQDVFFVSYESDSTMKKQVRVSLGSPRLVFIPDAVSDALAFFVRVQEEIPPNANVMESNAATMDPSDDRDDYSVAVQATDNQDEFEASLVRSGQGALATSNIVIHTDRCSLLLVDLGSSELLPAPGSRLSISVTSLAEAVVLEGMFDADISTDYDSVTGKTVSFDCEFQAKDVEAFTAYGSELSSPIQILEPAQISAYLTGDFKIENETGINVRIAAATPLLATVSMRNIALLNAVLASIDDSFAKETPGGSEIVSKDNRIERLESDSIRESESWPRPSLEPVFAGDDALRTERLESSAETQRRALTIKLTISEAKLTCINDLQGIDEAVLRVTVQNMTGAATLNEGRTIAGSSQSFTGFQLSLHTSVLADYFDGHANQWKVLLKKPWEIACKASRGLSNRFSSKRPSTVVDVESFPLQMSFSEQLLMAIASANYMWKVYTSAISSAMEADDNPTSGSRLRLSVATSAARALIKSLPYAMENHCGVDVDLIVQGNSTGRRKVAHGMVEYFQFVPPKGSGRGGARVYGQDVGYKKSFAISFGGSSVELENVDEQVALPARAYELDGQLIVCSALREGKTVVFHLSSGVDICNRTLLSLSIAVRVDGQDREIGICKGSSKLQGADGGSFKEVSVYQDGRVVKPSSRFGVPTSALREHRSAWERNGTNTLTLVVRPHLAGNSYPLSGSVTMACDSSSIHALQPMTSQHEMTCTIPSRATTEVLSSPLALRVLVITQIVNGFPCLTVAFEPRAMVRNRMPIPLSIRTPMPHTFTKRIDVGDGKESVHDLEPGESIQVFTPGPSIAVSIKCKDLPVAGSSTDWMDGWVDLPLVEGFQLAEPLRCFFPPSRQVADPLGMASGFGSPFLIAEGEDSISISKASQHAVAHSEAQEETRLTMNSGYFVVTVCNYAVDHTGAILFEHLGSQSANQYRRSASGVASFSERGNRSGRGLSAPLGAFRAEGRQYRVSLLPDSFVPLRILQLTMERDEGIRKGTPFTIDDVALCEGGALCTPLTWEDGSPSGYFAYRKLLNSYQSELHIVPGYVVFNGSSRHTLKVFQPDGVEISIGPGNIAALKTHSGETAIISAMYDFGATTSPLRVDALGLRVAVLKSTDGVPIGSVALQTVVGGRDSRLVIKVGEVKVGLASLPELGRTVLPMTLDNDFVRLRLQCSEVSVTLEKTKVIVEPKYAFMESALDRLQRRASPSSPAVPSEKGTWMDARSRREWSATNLAEKEAVCTILLHRCTCDWQRVFKQDEGNTASLRDALNSSERSQLSFIVHNVQIRDETPGSVYPVVFDSTSSVSFIDLCVRFRGPTNDALVKIDLFDLKLAHNNGKSQSIVINTNEEFVWKVLDLANRIMMAAAEFVGVNIALNWDGEHGGYSVTVSDKRTSFVDERESYSPPTSSVVYDINQVRVSPFTVLLSFKRIPQSSRYKLLTGVRGANIMNYFTTRLKFKIDHAELNFARFETRNVRGPVDHLVEMLSTVYLSRMKLKFVSIMTAASFQDWKKLASREGGDDEFVDGDILRVAGNIAGNSANYVLKKAGMGLGQGISTVTHALGDGIESATSAIGVGVVGAGVNSLVSGVGDGVSDALSGVGTGAGKVVKGVGQGVGQVFGGLSGGAMLVGKGIGKGLIEGDGRAIATGLADGATSVGTGVGQGIESLVQGTASGVYSVGSGFFSGAKAIGQGIGGALRAMCSCSCCCASNEEASNNSRNILVTPLIDPDAPSEFQHLIV